MEGRYTEPTEPSPDLLLINHYLWLADPLNRATEQDRERAINSILVLYRAQRDDVGRGTIPQIDTRLRWFVRDLLFRCANCPDPLGAMERFLGEKHRRGRPTTPHRDFVIAGDVAEQIEDGVTVDEACARVADQAHLSPEQIRRIYFDQKREDPTGLNVDLARRKRERKRKK